MSDLDSPGKYGAQMTSTNQRMSGPNSLASFSQEINQPNWDFVQSIDVWSKPVQVNLQSAEHKKCWFDHIYHPTFTNRNTFISTFERDVQNM